MQSRKLFCWVWWHMWSSVSVPSFVTPKVASSAIYSLSLGLPSIKTLKYLLKVIGDLRPSGTAESRLGLDNKQDNYWRQNS